MDALLKNLLRYGGGALVGGLCGCGVAGTKCSPGKRVACSAAGAALGTGLVVAYEHMKRK